MSAMNCSLVAEDASGSPLIFPVASHINCSWLFNNTSPNINGEGLYDVPGALIALLSVFYGTISVVAVVGNSLVMWIVATSRRMQNVTNCFIANLALADIVIGLLPSLFNARPSKLRAKIFIACIWGVAGMLAAPMAMALRVTMVESVDSMGREYVKPFCRNVHFTEQEMMSYRFVLVFLQYVTPLCVISCVYARMALRLWGSRAPGNAQDSRDANLMKNKKKVIKMLVIVVALFALCWLPLQTYNVLQDVFPAINGYRYINIIWFCCDWLAMSNSCYNPFIYGIYNEKFKREFQQRFPFRNRRWTGSGMDSVDLDKTFLGGRTSMHSTSLSQHHSIHHSDYGWRRSYTSRHPSSNGVSFRQHSVRTPRRSRDKDMYLFQTQESSIIRHASQTELQELCL